ncbi:TPA: tetratricopeptide repeat protein [Haemophilus influenzae]
MQPLAAQGHAKAQNSLGNMYNDGKGVKQDYAEAIKWYQKAAEQDYAKAQFNLGTMYHNGEGVKRDLSKAKEWFRKACDKGNKRLVIL